jgi:hypothetical protein
MLVFFMADLRVYLQGTGICLALGSLCFAGEIGGHLEISQLKQKLISDWTTTLTKADGTELERVASLYGLVSVMGYNGLYANVGSYCLFLEQTERKFKKFFNKYFHFNLLNLCNDLILSLIWKLLVAYLKMSEEFFTTKEFKKCQTVNWATKVLFQNSVCHFSCDRLLSYSFLLSFTLNLFLESRH